MIEERQKKLWDSYFKQIGQTIGTLAIKAKYDGFEPQLLVHAVVASLSVSLLGLGFTAEQVREMLMIEMNAAMGPTNVLWKQLEELAQKFFPTDDSPPDVSRGRTFTPPV